MKKLFTLILLLCTVAGFAQQYNNEWINPSKTYYKFKVGRTGLYRIPQATLAAIGLGAVPAEQLQLWRNGQELALYTSSPTGVLPAGGFVEFWGEANDGKPDKPLYRDPAYQHTDKLSLITDTAAFFLTVNSTGVNQRFADAPNNIAGNTLLPEPYFMYTAGRYFRNQINPGLAAVIGEYVHSSVYDKGEFLCSPTFTPGSPLSDAMGSLAVFAGGPDASIRFGAVGTALNARTFQVKVNGTLVKDTTCNYFNDVISTASVPLSTIAAGNASLQFVNTSAVGTDRSVVSYYELTYPRLFDFGGQANFPFQLRPSTSGYYLQVTNFNSGNVAPVLYDLTYQQRYTGDVSTPGMVKFVLPAAASGRQLLLVAEAATNITGIAATDISTRSFIDFNNVSNQSDYLIISNPVLYNGANGSNPVDDYRRYRTSADGGGYNAKVMDIDQLTDQFAFGIKKDPLSVKNFLRFARARFAVAPKFAFIIGRAVNYMEYRYNESNAYADQLNLVPTFGWPASDPMLASADGASPIPLTYIGRLSAVNSGEVADYLTKVKEYEHAQKYNANTIADRAWMKNIVKITGANDAYLGAVLCNYMEGYKQICQDTLIGGNVTIFCKSTTSDVEQLSSNLLANLFSDGISMITYFGHSSNTTLQFNIDNPYNYNNAGKYPFFSVNGCNAGDFFVFDPLRITQNKLTISETYTLAKQRGGIAFLASTHFGVVNYLNIYLNGLFTLMGKTDYGAAIGKAAADAGSRLVQIAGSGDFFARLHAEEMVINGDPSLKLNFQPKPDYDMEASQVKINPQFVSIAADQFTAGIKIYNLGKAIDDSIVVEVKRQFPDNSVQTILRNKMRAPHFTDSLLLTIPVVASRDKGLNKLIITVDADNKVDEMDETNNTVTKEFFIYEDELKPCYPYNYSIVNRQGAKLYASTANPFASLKQYVMEIDTTANFNSSLKVSKTISSVGGLLEFDPGISFSDSTVYYWRASFVPASGGDYHWNVFSFIYLPGSSPGFNQSHYFQHLDSKADRISLSAGRVWQFRNNINNLFLRNSTYPTGGGYQSDYVNTINGNSILGPGCNYNELVIQVIDGVRFQPWRNNFTGATGLYGSEKATCGSQREYNFDYLLNTSDSRKKIMDFIDSIPDGSYVIVRSNTNPVDSLNTFSSAWKSDTTLFGSGNSLYHKLYSQGFITLDSFNKARSWIFLFRKNKQDAFPSHALFSQTIYDKIFMDVDCPTPDSLGYITSPLFGPAKAWKQVHWRGASLETPSPDAPSVNVLGITPSGQTDTLFRMDANTRDLDISSINATQYPYLKLRMRNMDSVYLTPYQLKYWRINYDPVPEGALTPNIYLRTKNPAGPVDSLEIGEPLHFGIAFKNISDVAFDSLKLKCYILDRNNVAHYIVRPRLKPLVSADSVHFDYDIDTKLYPGMNTIYVDFNPDGDQPEQFHFNNFLFRNFYVKPDSVGPMLDVTFDNVHILNRDIVSAKPHIQIKLQDNSKFLLLNDTSEITVKVRFPDNSIRTYRFGDSLRFTPAGSGSNNSALIDFFPAFLKQIDPAGDEYQLIVSGKDRSGNSAGTTEYKVIFRVISKPMISNLLNYPNPFTTSTAFVFTITGSEVPQNMKIQILTITGKIVREITKQELGPLHIGRNITEYKWDGNDQFGQRLANGVYLYRFVTQLDGKRMDKYKVETDKTDKFFNNGYGKMYLMR